jgi:hypothetical protein
VFCKSIAKHPNNMSEKANKFNDFFTNDDLERNLEDFQQGIVYFLTKRSNPQLFAKASKLIQPGYFRDRQNEIESIDLVISGSIEKPYQITVQVGRKDRFKGAESFDIDVFNIAPESGSSDSYFLNQWHHIQDQSGNRISKIINPIIVPDETQRTDILYSTYLTGSFHSASLEEYEQLRPDIFQIHTQTFGKLG